MSFFNQNFEFVKPSFPEFSKEEFDLLRKCAFMLIHKNVSPNLFVSLTIQYLCSLILQHENLIELEKESNEA